MPVAGGHTELATLLVVAAGRRVPSETTLSQQYGVPRGTAKKALDSLVDAGLVHRVQGRGSFVV